MINSRSQKGFTLVELTVVMSMISIMAGIFYVNYRDSSKALILEREAYKIMQDIRSVEEMALSSREVSGEFEGKGSFGIIFNAQENVYISFAGGGTPLTPTGPEGSVPLKEYMISNEIDIVEINGTEEDVFGAVRFTPPDPTVGFVKLTISPFVYYWPESITVKIALKDDPSKVKSIKINSLGLIYVE